ncbi:hypothetical protein ACQP2X_22355 [Actinoplanes sp. CA-131856]
MRSGAASPGRAPGARDDPGGQCSAPAEAATGGEPGWPAAPDDAHARSGAARNAAAVGVGRDATGGVGRTLAVTGEGCGQMSAAGGGLGPGGVVRAAGRVAAVAGMLGVLWHLALAGEHARHAPVITVGMLVLSLVCVRCGVHLWRSPGDRGAWRDLIVLAVVMTAMHAAAGGLTPAALLVPVVQAGLAMVALAGRRGSVDGG